VPAGPAPTPSCDVLPNTVVPDLPHHTTPHPSSEGTTFGLPVWLMALPAVVVSRGRGGGGGRVGGAGLERRQVQRTTTLQVNRSHVRAVRYQRRRRLKAAHKGGLG
jgi:hypothetical protein